MYSSSVFNISFYAASWKVYKKALSFVGIFNYVLKVI